MEEKLVNVESELPIMEPSPPVATTATSTGIPGNNNQDEDGPKPTPLITPDKEKADAFMVGTGANRERFRIVHSLIKVPFEEYERILWNCFANSEGIYELPKVEPNIFQYIVNYLYLPLTWKHPSIFTNIHALLKAAENFDLYELVRSVHEEVLALFLDNGVPLEVSNVCYILNSVEYLDFEGEKVKKIKNFICRKADEILRHPSMFHLSLDAFVEVVRQDGLRLESELSVFLAVFRWICRYPQAGIRRLTGCQRERLLFLSQFIRFPRMNYQELERFVFPTGVLSAEQEQALKVYFQLRDPAPAVEQEEEKKILEIHPSFCVKRRRYQVSKIEAQAAAFDALDPVKKVKRMQGVLAKVNYQVRYTKAVLPRCSRGCHDLKKAIDALATHAKSLCQQEEVENNSVLLNNGTSSGVTPLAAHLLDPLNGNGDNREEASKVELAEKSTTGMLKTLHLLHLSSTQTLRNVSNKLSSVMTSLVRATELLELYKPKASTTKKKKKNKRAKILYSKRRASRKRKANGKADEASSVTPAKKLKPDAAARRVNSTAGNIFSRDQHDLEDISAESDLELEPVSDYESAMELEDVSAAESDLELEDISGPSDLEPVSAASDEEAVSPKVTPASSLPKSTPPGKIISQKVLNKRRAKKALKNIPPSAVLVEAYKSTKSAIEKFGTVLPNGTPYDQLTSLSFPNFAFCAVILENRTQFDLVNSQYYFSGVNRKVVSESSTDLPANIPRNHTGYFGFTFLGNVLKLYFGYSIFNHTQFAFRLNKQLKGGEVEAVSFEHDFSIALCSNEFETGEPYQFYGKLCGRNWKPNSPFKRMTYCKEPNLDGTLAFQNITVRARVIGTEPTTVSIVISDSVGAGAST